MDLKTQILHEGGNLLLRVDLFDTYTKKEDEAITSFAFRLVFESPGKTLTDDEVNAIMQKITLSLTRKGYEVR
jgi:phenylalanyl-tRNA synthetase beta subunit